MTFHGNRGEWRSYHSIAQSIKDRVKIYSSDKHILLYLRFCAIDLNSFFLPAAKFDWHIYLLMPSLVHSSNGVYYE